jgi:hypothetical protein
MLSSTSSSERAAFEADLIAPAGVSRGARVINVPRPIAIMLGMVLSFLVLLELGTRVFVAPASRIERRVESEYAGAASVRRGAGAKHVLVLGNSLLDADVDFDMLRGAFSPQWEARRLVVEQTAFLDWYYGMRHLIESGAEPDVIALVLSPDDLTSLEIRGDYSVYRLMGPREVLPLSREMHLHPTVATGYMLASVSAFYGLRTEYRKVLLGRLMPDMQELAHYIGLRRAPRLPNSVVYRRVRERLARTKAMLDRHGIRLVLAIPPFPTYHSGNEIVRHAALDVGVCVVIPFEAGSFVPQDFGSDQFHMNAMGARRYTMRLVPALRAVLQ